MSRYLRQEEIGRGSWSVVYKAVDDMNGDVVAIKELIDKAGLPKREIAIGRLITHPNVCRIYDYFVSENGSKCIAMEFVDGGSLRNLMEQSGPMPVEKCLSIARQILDGLEAAHLEKIVHRDLKPENILLTSDGKVKLSDFGHARVIGTEPSLESKLQFGTPAYMAPEQRMERECDARADIFSFGVILHELLSGKRPQPQAYLSLPSGLPAHIKAAIRQCLEFDPARRFTSVSKVRDALFAARMIQPVPVITGLLVISLAAVLAGILLWNYVWLDLWKPLPVPARALTPVQEQTPPTATVPQNPAATRKTIQRVAVMDFENLTGEKSLDPYTVGISETLSTELAYVQGLTLVARNRVNEAIQELQPGRTGIVTVRTAREIGKLIGADSLIAGSFQKVGDKVRLTASVFDAETSLVVRTPAMVDGAFNDLFQLQAELAKQLAVAIPGTMTEADRKYFEGTIVSGATGRGLEAFEAFSAGLYFLRNDLAADALSKFDRTLAIDHNYPGAHHYRGMALAKLNRLDEAIDAFKTALPRSEPEQLVLWSWDAPFASMPGSTGAVAPQHGIIRAVDYSQLHLQRYAFEGRNSGSLQKRIVYSERSDKATVLHFLDLEGHGVRRLEIPDENICLNGPAYANDSFTVVFSRDPTPGALPCRIGLYSFSADSSLLWHMDLTEYGRDIPQVALIGDALYIYRPGLLRFDLIDTRTGSLLWRREGLSVESLEPPQVRHTKAYGDILIFKSQDIYRAIRKSDGTDAWTLRVESQKASDLANDRVLIVFEPERRIYAVDLETGKTVAEVNIEQYVDALPSRIGSKWLVAAVLEGNTLYVLSRDLDLCAIDLTGARPNPNARPNALRVRWRTPLKKKPQSIRIHGNRLYLGTDAGELIVIDTAAGAITNTTKLTEQIVIIEYAGDDAVLVRSNNTLYGIEPLGAKKWEYPSIAPKEETTYFNRVITVYTAPLQLSALDVATGKLLWQYDVTIGGRMPRVFTTAARFFILGETGVKEYSVGKRPPPSLNQAVTDKETLTELAGVYVVKGDLEQARVFVEKASEIDGNYPPLTLARARLLKAQGSKDRAGRELARYASLVGLDSKEGQRAISEVKRDHGLLWETAIGPDVPGDPVIIENRLVSAGRGVGRESHIVALDLQSGAVVWSYAAERFVSSVAGEYNRRFSLWYVSGFVADATTVNLYRVDIRTGERKQMASWRRPSRIDQVWIAYAGGHIFVATGSPDFTTRMLQVGIACFDAASGARLWEKSHDSKANAIDLALPVGLFAAQSDSLTYSIAQERWTIRATDGSALPALTQPVAAEHSWELRGDNAGVEIDKSTGRVVARHAVLWRPSSFRIQSGRLYAFTADGHAYAMREVRGRERE